MDNFDDLREWGKCLNRLAEIVRTTVLCQIPNESRLIL